MQVAERVEEEAGRTVIPAATQLQVDVPGHALGHHLDVFFLTGATTEPPDEFTVGGGMVEHRRNTHE